MRDPCAEMRMVDWEDVRHLVALAKAGTLSGAARALGVDHATVGRRIASLERSLETTLVERTLKGYRLGQKRHQRFCSCKRAARLSDPFSRPKARDLARTTSRIAPRGGQ